MNSGYMFIDKYTSKLQWLHCSHYDYCYHCNLYCCRNFCFNRHMTNVGTSYFLSELVHAKRADVALKKQLVCSLVLTSLPAN